MINTFNSQKEEFAEILKEKLKQEMIHKKIIEMYRENTVSYMMKSNKDEEDVRDLLNDMEFDAYKSCHTQKELEDIAIETQIECGGVSYNGSKELSCNDLI